MAHKACSTNISKKNLYVGIGVYRFFSLDVFIGPGPGEKFQVPRMYNTEYQFYGSEKPVTV